MSEQDPVRLVAITGGSGAGKASRGPSTTGTGRPRGGSGYVVAFGGPSVGPAFRIPRVDSIKRIHAITACPTG